MKNAGFIKTKMHSLQLLFIGYLSLILINSCTEHQLYEAHFIKQNIVIDGKPDSIWNSAKKEPILNIQRGKFYWDGVNDLSGNFRILWNAKYLYLYFEVTDDIFFHRDDILPYYNDGIEVYLDLSNDKKDKLITGDDFQLQFTFDSTFVFGINSISQGIKYKRCLHDGSYDVEIQIAWNALNTTPRDGLQIGFDAGILDNDTKPGELTKSFQTTMTWSKDGIISWRSTSGYGNLKLVGTNK